jgi:hypothetical protein
MCCYHNRRPKTGCSPSSVFRLPSFRDDRGQAALEGILVFAFLVAVLLGCMLLGQWGMHLQYAQMGARMLTFNASDEPLAKLGRPGNTATQTLSSSDWDTLSGVSALPTAWLNTMFVGLSNDRYAGRVAGTQHGRLAGQGPSMFDYAPASVGYHSGAAAATNPWADTTSDVRSMFMGIAYNVGRYRLDPQTISTKPTVPPAIAVLESIYARSGVR